MDEIQDEKKKHIVFLAGLFPIFCCALLFISKNESYLSTLESYSPFVYFFYGRKFYNFHFVLFYYKINKKFQVKN
jgi:hypothetical protein